MVMDGNIRGYYGATSGIKFNKEAVSVFPDPNPIFDICVNDTIVDQNYIPCSSAQSELNSNIFDLSSNCDSHEDYDFNDVVLKCISEMLMEEDMEDKVCMFQESAALQAAEKSFYEVLGEKYPPAPDHQLTYLDVTSSTTSLSSYTTSASSNGTLTDEPVNSPDSTIKISDIFSDSQSVMQFNKGVEEANKFLPDGNALVVDYRDNGMSGKDHGNKTVSDNEEKKYESEYSPDGSRGKKNLHVEDMDQQEGRSNKQPAIYTDSTVRSEMFDTVLLCSGGENEAALCEALQIGASKSTLQSSQSKGSNSGKSRGKKQGGRRNVVDLRILLSLCAQSISANDRRTANEFLKQIRQHSSPTGDGMQRLAHYFADGLEARMAGSGTQIYKALSLPASALDILKAYQICIAASPFRKISIFFSNKTIWHAAEKASRLHIVDFGIRYGFQWPCLIQRLSSRPGGPPKLRITGIDFPNPGFRPSERVEETGRRLANYAETFNVPFEFNAIAQKWDTIAIEDLKLSEDEVLVVNCLYGFRNLLDETVLVNSPRNMVLNLIRKMNPDVFVLGIVNGAYSAPFFITRFREALFHYSSLFDMLEANIPREIHERMLIEKSIYGREAMNVIACEAAERLERPETYKQWQVRNLRAGFRQLPLNEEIVKMAKERVNSYHKDFVIDEDSQWLLQGWKGRIVYALSSWRPAH